MIGPDLDVLILREARFLCARLREFERAEITPDQYREWNGHVSPSLARLESLIDDEEQG